MKLKVDVCELCARADGILRIASGKYYAQEAGQWVNVCATHLKEVSGYGFDTEKFEYAGNVDEELLWAD